MIRHVSPPTSRAARGCATSHRRPPGSHPDRHAVAAGSTRCSPSSRVCRSPGPSRFAARSAAVDAARREDPHGAVITSSAGNHGLGIAHAATFSACRRPWSCPTNASAAKVKKLREYDIELIQFGSSYDEAQRHALELAQQRAIRYISPFNDTNVIAGQATVFDEMLLQAPDLEHLVVSVGGGGLHLGRADVARGARPRRHPGHWRAARSRASAMYHVLRGANMAEIVHRPDHRRRPRRRRGRRRGHQRADRAHTRSRSCWWKRSRSAGPCARSPESNGLVIEGSAAAVLRRDHVRIWCDDATSRIGFIACGRNISHELFLALLQEPLR